jgi:uncharacterized membrane protein
MNVAIACALAAMAAYGCADFVYKRAAAAGLAADQFLMGQSWCFSPALVVYAWATGTFALDRAALWGAVAGVVMLIGLYNYSRSLQVGSVSVIAPVFRLNFIVTTVLAIVWLREPLTLAKVSGCACAMAAGWLLLGGAPRHGIDAAARRRSLIQVLIATVATGIGNFCYKLGLLGGATAETILVAQAVVFTTLVTAMSLRRHGRLLPPPGFLLHGGPAAIALLAAFLFLLHGLKYGQASVVVPIAQMGFVVAAVLGGVVFREAWTGRKFAGIGAAIIALALLAMG